MRDSGMDWVRRWGVGTMKEGSREVEGVRGREAGTAASF